MWATVPHQEGWRDNDGVWRSRCVMHCITGVPKKGGVGRRGRRNTLHTESHHLYDGWDILVNGVRPAPIHGTSFSFQLPGYRGECVSAGICKYLNTDTRSAVTSLFQATAIRLRRILVEIVITHTDFDSRSGTCNPLHGQNRDRLTEAAHESEEAVIRRRAIATASTSSYGIVCSLNKIKRQRRESFLDVWM